MSINNIFNIWNSYKSLKPTIFFAFAKKKFTYQDLYKSKVKHQIKDLYKEKYIFFWRICLGKFIG